MLRANKLIVLDGPEDFNIEEEFQKWKHEIIERVGPEPNIVCYGHHIPWLKKQIEVLKEYQEKYNCMGDFPTLFIAHLLQRCNFQRRECDAVKLV